MNGTIIVQISQKRKRRNPGYFQRCKHLNALPATELTKRPGKHSMTTTDLRKSGEKWPVVGQEMAMESVGVILGGKNGIVGLSGSSG